MSSGSYTYTHQVFVVNHTSNDDGNDDDDDGDDDDNGDTDDNYVE